MTTYEILSVVFGGIAALGSLATAASVTAAFIAYNKNQVKKKTLKIDFVCTRRIIEADSVAHGGELTFINATPHALTISYAAIYDNDKEYPFSFMKHLKDSAFYDYAPYKDISLSEREIKHVDGYFDLPKNFSKIATLKVITSYGTFRYQISLQEKSCNQEPEADNPQYCPR